jgi:hypothetical protein
MKLFTLFLFSFYCVFSAFAADTPSFYVKVTNTRTYMNVDRVTVTEYWFSNGNYCSQNNQTKLIYRPDQGVRYFINLKNNTYRVDSIKKPSAKEASTQESIKYLGRYYYPEYEWNKPEKLRKDTVGNFKCEHFYCDGDADFDQIYLDFYMTRMNDYAFARFVSTTIFNIKEENNKSLPLFTLITRNKNLMPLRIIEKVENPIAPQIITKINLDKFEQVTLPDGIFEIPASLKKIN